MEEIIDDNIPNEEELEYQYPHDDINAAVNALSAFDGFDEKLVSASLLKKIKATRRFAINIIYEQMKYLHSCIFSDQAPEED